MYIIGTYTGRGLYSNTSDEGVKVAAASVAGQKNTCEVASNNVWHGHMTYCFMIAIS